MMSCELLSLDDESIAAFLSDGDNRHNLRVGVCIAQTP